MEGLILDIKRYRSHYLALAIILGIGLGVFTYFRFQPLSQSVAVFLTSSAYLFWGIIHHKLEGDLHLKVVLEYLLISLIIDLLVISLILRA